MPRKKDPPLSPAEQRKRLEELARQVGATASAGDIKKTLSRISRLKENSTKKGKHPR